jgi:7-keto-8-aminopelargonate synthetase-like enzyme
MPKHDRRTGHAPGASTTAGILHRAEAFGGALDRLLQGNENPLGLVLDDISSPVEAVIGGRPTLLFGTNSYLGLNFHPRTIDAAVAATRHQGTGSTASRVAAGNHRLHLELEADIAALYGRRHAIVFSTGFMANLGVIGGLVREGDALFLDAHCHASIFAAARLSGAKIQSFRHNDTADLDRLFRERAVEGPSTMVVVEGVYSIRGDIADLGGIVAVARRYGAVLVVDEAHGFGTYGERGRGVCEFLGVEDGVDIIVGTFSKSVGVIGGYCVTDLDALRSLRFAAQPYLYTASLPPSVVAAAREAVRLIERQPELRETLWRNARALHAGLVGLGLDVCAPVGPVGSIRMPGLRPGYEFWKALLARGVYVNLLLPPATPDGEVVLRFSVSAAHTPEHIETAVAAFGEVSRQRKSA